MTRTSRSIVVGVSVLALTALTGASVALAVTPRGSSSVFQQLTKSLQGEWHGTFQGTEITLTYTLTANDSALMEEFRPQKGPVMITMFTVDGDHLIAAHYCSAGNQPYMATAAITEPQAKRIAFALTNVTGLTTPDDWHNTALVMTLEDDNHLTQEWTYLDKGSSGKTVFHFSRAQ